MSRRNNSRSRSGGRGRKGKQPKKVVPVETGRVQMTREGFAFIVIEDSEDDVFVKASKTRGALNGDIVRVAVTREKSDTHRREGEVVEILERSPKPFIGILYHFSWSSKTKNNRSVPLSHLSCKSKESEHENHDYCYYNFYTC